jgi:hypothetical protein
MRVYGISQENVRVKDNLESSLVKVEGKKLGTISTSGWLLYNVISIMSKIPSNSITLQTSNLEKFAETKEISFSSKILDNLLRYPSKIDILDRYTIPNFLRAVRKFHMKFRILMNIA